jgi:hypothetical protein
MRDPPNQAARPRSCMLLMTVLRSDMCFSESSSEAARGPAGVL